MKTSRLFKPLLFISLAALPFTSCKKEKGCTDPQAVNYNIDAEKDDGSCLYDNGTNGGNNTTYYELNSDVTSDLVITNTNIRLCGGIAISAGLTLPAGATIVCCEGAAITVLSGGYIKAVGTASEPIIFKGESSVTDYWAGIRIESNSPNNIFDYVQISDAGGYWFYEDASVFLTGGRLSISNTVISNASDEGLFVKYGSTLASFSNNVFSNCLVGLKVPADMVHMLDASSDYNYNGTNTYDYIYVDGFNAAITVPVTWKKLPTPLYIAGSVGVKALLTLQPGIEIIEAGGEGITVQPGGALTAIGTPTEHIIIRGASPIAGFAMGVRIETNDANNRFEYVDFSYGGSYWLMEYSTLHIENGASASVDNCSFTSSNSYAIYVENNSTIRSGGAIQTTPAGVESYNTFTNNGTGANSNNCTGGCTVYIV